MTTERIREGKMKPSEMAFDELQINDSNSKNIRLCRRYVSKFEEMMRGNRWLLFWGNKGTGKSLTASVIKSSLIDRYSVEMLAFSELLDKLRRNENELLQADLVIVDDLSPMTADRSAVNTVCEYLDDRHGAGKPMIFISRLTPIQMQAEPNEQYRRLFDFILMACCPMQFTGKDWRA